MFNQCKKMMNYDDYILSFELKFKLHFSRYYFEEKKKWILKLIKKNSINIPHSQFSVHFIDVIGELKKKIYPLSRGHKAVTEY